MRTYREGLTLGPEMTKALKMYKGHRRISAAHYSYLGCVLKLFCLEEMFHWLYCFLLLTLEVNTYCSDLIINFVEFQKII